MKGSPVSVAPQVLQSYADWLGREVCRMTKLAELGQNDMRPLGSQRGQQKGRLISGLHKTEGLGRRPQEGEERPRGETSPAYEGD